MEPKERALSMADIPDARGYHTRRTTNGAARVASNDWRSYEDRPGRDRREPSDSHQSPKWPAVSLLVALSLAVLFAVKFPLATLSILAVAIAARWLFAANKHSRRAD